ncbi:toxin-antitoxin system YwqK family antitoxin [Anatilimnocola sp. NA78]|uniref:toxin-antitoxin system YwqK family antitoxin n=1 Tax=Anatilimnocola sp. NA78 TaxID=3415683 RepID=UPI003CE50471
MASESTTTNKPWYRRFRIGQFSMRSLLILMATVGIACWYWQLPKLHTEQWAGGELVLKREYRGQGPLAVNQPFGLLDTDFDGFNDGTWRLSEVDGALLIAGNYRGDKQHGAWAAYHPNGKLAQRGQMKDGLRRGIWRKWSESGLLVSEFTFGKGEQRQVPAQPWRELAQGGCILRAPSRTPTPLSENGCLHGSAQTWHENGQLKAAGSYFNNVRTGTWKHWNEHAELVATGDYLYGQQHGKWQEFDPQTKQLATTEYVNGLRKSVLDEQVKLLAERLAETTDTAERIVLLQMATEFGPPAAPLLENVIASEANARVEFAAIMACGACTDDYAPWRERLANLSANDDPVLAAVVRWAKFQLFSVERKALLPAVLQDLNAAAETSWTNAISLLKVLYEQVPEHRDQVFPLILRIAAEHQAEWDRDCWAYLQRGTNSPFTAGGDFPRTSVNPCVWGQDSVPHLQQALAAPDRQLRIAAIYVLHAMLRDAHEERQRQMANTNIGSEYDIPEHLAPLVQQARGDKDPEVAKCAEDIAVDWFFNLDESGQRRRSTGGAGGFGGGGLF